MGRKFDIDEDDYVIGRPNVSTDKKDEAVKKKKTDDVPQTKQVKKEKSSFDFSKVFSDGEKGKPTTIKLNDLQKEVLKLTAEALGINDGQSGIIREALDQYFQKLNKNEELRNFIETMLRYKKKI